MIFVSSELVVMAVVVVVVVLRGGVCVGWIW